MKQTSERFNKAYNALIEAYHNNILRSGDCNACAVGNICRESSQLTGIVRTMWSSLFYTSKGGSRYRRNKDYSNERVEKALKLIGNTGYSEDELSIVEYVFETNTKYHHDEYYLCSEKEVLEDQFNGLSAVIDALLSFEEEQQDSLPYKERMKHPKLQTA